MPPWGNRHTPEVTLLKDPNWHLMAAVYEDMDADDKGEFPEMKSAIKRKKAQHVGLEQQCKKEPDLERNPNIKSQVKGQRRTETASRCWPRRAGAT